MTTWSGLLPPELAPALRARVLDLLAQVRLVDGLPPVEPRRRRRLPVNRCTVCHRDGILGGHHQADGEIVWIHRGCHRRLHRSERRPVSSHSRRGHSDRRGT